MSEPLNLGTYADEEEAKDSAVREILSFRRAGGVFSWGEWAQMSGFTRECAMQAGMLFEVERAETITDEVVERLNDSDQQAREDAILDFAEEELS